MLLRGNYIGQQCAKPNHELQTTLHPTTASVLKLGRSPLAPVHRGVSPAYTKSVDRSAQVDVSSAAASSQSMIAENDATSRVRGEATQETVDLAILWACQHGLIVGGGVPEKPFAITHAPMTVLPTPFPFDSFQKAQAAMGPFNSLFDKVSRDDEYLQNTLRPAAEHDDFTAKLLEIHRNTQEVRHQRRVAQAELILALNRSDYMLDEPSGTLMQVEMNTISSSFGCLCTLVSQMHSFILQSQGAQPQVLDCLPGNNVTEAFVLAMAATVQEHNRVSGNADSIIVFVVQPDEKNSFDQQWLQTTLLQLYSIKTVRQTLAQLSEGAEVSPTGQLSLGGLPVSLVYFRAGYAPTDYPSDVEWNIRERLERCNAALCPSVAYQLAGSKKVQQDLARPGVLERFIDDPNEVESLRDCFAGLWSLDDLDDPETASVLQQAIEKPDRFVLKPQREGGGNNLYGDALQQKLQTRKGLSAYILMQRIRPPINRSVMVREGQVVEADTLSELGIFGYLVRRGDKVLHNKGAGHMMRTKAATSDEGGVAAGFAVLDSVVLKKDSR